MSSGLRSAHTAEQGSAQVVEALARQLEGSAPKAIVFFASHRHDGAAISGGLRQRFAGCEVIGCTTAGEFTQAGTGVGGVTALALGSPKVKRAAGALATFERGVSSGVALATERIAQALESPLRGLDPKRYAGVILVEGLQMHEEEANEALGNVAPLLSFVGGSAGDNLEFKQTRVFCNGAQSDNGAALLVLEAPEGFAITKSCSFKSTGKSFRVTRADVANRVIYELDGKPVAEVYASAVGTSKDKLDGAVFMKNPMGLVIDNAPWIRSPQQLLPDGGLKFYCKIQEGMDLHLMAATDLIGETRAALARSKSELGGKLSGGLAFNCILRRLDLDAQSLHSPFVDSFQGTQLAGFHTYGESYLGHINQTLTALMFA